MASVEDFQAAFGRVNEATNGIAAKLTELRDQLSNSGLSSEQEAEVLSQLDTLASQLTSMAQDPENPVPEPTE